jgi:hypothetical protein
VSFSIGASGSKEVDQIEMLQYTNSTLVSRVVGDGDTLWTYDLAHKTYSAIRYGGYGATRPASYRLALLYAVDLAATREAAYVAHFLRDVYHTDGSGNLVPEYRSWMPSVTTPTDLPQGPQVDPVNPNVTYDGTPTTDFVLYNGSPNRTIAFQLQDDPPNANRALATITFDDVSTVGSQKAYTSWVLTPYTQALFAPANFQPYTAAQIQYWRPVPAQPSFNTTPASSTGGS